MPELPTGTVTFLFTDIEGSTRLWESQPEAMRVALGRHDTLVREAIAAHRGHIFKTIGDAFCAAFDSAQDAALAARQSQAALATEPWATPTPLKVRMALETGAAEYREGDYFGRPLNRVARLLAAGHGGQVLVATSTREVLSSDLPLDDLGVHQLRDIPEPVRIFQLPYDGQPPQFPPLRTQTELVQNQPRVLTAFVGREQKLLDWSQQLQEGSRRLFTITGPGGVGKTRVAMQLGETVARRYPDQVWWCELEQATTVDEAVNRLALALQVALQPGSPVREQLFRHLRPRHTLLILDNLEQVVGASLLLRDLLAEAPQVTCLVTSRRTLDMRGEVVLELEPLSEAESVGLFVERATECRPDFVLDDENQAEVAELCRRLEGVPLAIELAAARTVGMTPGQILQRLNERFRLLQSRSMELNERQRALRGAIDWSYNLLRDDDREIFAQLSVFAGGFTLEDAEAICEGFDVLESVLELRKQSLFRTTANQRFVMFDSLREYAAEKLAQTPDQGRAIRERHARTFLRFAQERLAQVRTPTEVHALRELDANAANLNAAKDSALALGHDALAAALCLVVGIRLHRQGFSRSAAETIQQGLDCVARLSQPDSALQGQLLLERAGLHYDFGEDTACAALSEQARALFSSQGDSRGTGRAENLLGQAALLQKRFVDAVAHFNRAQTLFAQGGDQTRVAIALNNLSLALRRDRTGTADEQTERRRQAGEHLAEALRIRREAGDRRGTAETLNNLGVLAFENNAFTESWAYYFEALGIERELHNRQGIGVALANLGEVAGIQDNPVLGTHLLLASAQVLAEIASPYVPGIEEMATELSATAGWDSAQLQAARAHLRGLTIEERCAWAFPSQEPTS